MIQRQRDPFSKQGEKLPKLEWNLIKFMNQKESIQRRMLASCSPPRLLLFSMFEDAALVSCDFEGLYISASSSLDRLQGLPTIAVLVWRYAKPVVVNVFGTVCWFICSTNVPPDISLQIQKRPFSLCLCCCSMLSFNSKILRLISSSCARPDALQDQTPQSLYHPVPLQRHAIIHDHGKPITCMAFSFPKNHPT